MLRRTAGWLERIAFPEARAAGEQWQRRVLNERIDEHLRLLDPKYLGAAEISGANHGELPWRKHVSLDYPAFDLCAELPPAAGTFDVVICEQVLEHVPDPRLAAANLRQLAKPGGRVIVSTPFLIPIHELPAFGMGDYWRFTPRGLRTLLENAGLQVEEMGSWGNRTAVLANLRRWSRYRPWYPVGNESRMPVQIWAFARRP